MFKSKRLYTNLIIFASIFILPWWVPVILSIISSWFYFYVEIIFVGFILDLLYRSDLFVKIFGSKISLFFTILLTVIMVLIRVIKKQMRFY